MVEKGAGANNLKCQLEEDQPSELQVQQGEQHWQVLRPILLPKKFLWLLEEKTWLLKRLRKENAKRWTGRIVRQLPLLHWTREGILWSLTWNSRLLFWPARDISNMRAKKVTMQGRLPLTSRTLWSWRARSWMYGTSLGWTSHPRRMYLLRWSTMLLR